jgi:hypothetical protein
MRRCLRSRGLTMISRLGLRRILAALLLLGLVALLVVRGVVPAFTVITDDFPTYYTAAKSVRDGEDPAKLYNPDWFRAQRTRYQVGPPENLLEFSPQPPPTALLLTPLAGFAPQTALRILTIVDLLCLIGASVLLSRIVGWSLLNSGLFVLLSGWALHSGLRFGQPYILISTFCLAGYYCYLRGLPRWAGLLMGVFAPIKYFPVMILGAFALQGRWRVVVAGAIAIAVVLLVSVSVLGWPVHQIFLSEVLLGHLSGHLIPGPRFFATFQSFDTLYERLFILDATRNPHPFIDAPNVAVIALIGTKALSALAAAISLFKLARGKGERALGASIGILGVLTLLLAPGSGTYAFVLLWLPVALLVDYFKTEHRPWPGYLIVATYVGIGFIPYGHTARFEGEGVLTVLAYPRLLLMLAMFAVCMFALVDLPSLKRGRSDLAVGNA